MIKKEFARKLLDYVIGNALSQKRISVADTLYLTSSIEIILEEKDQITFKIDDKTISFVYNNTVIYVLLNNIKTKFDEYALACVMYYKKIYYLKNGIGFDEKDFKISQYYYNIFISHINYIEYQHCLIFYFGLIDELFKQNMEYECLDLIVDVFNFITMRFSYDTKYADMERQNQFKLIQDKQLLIVNNCDYLIELFKKKNIYYVTIARFINILVINYPTILQKQGIKKIYDLVFLSAERGYKKTQLYSKLQTQYNVTRWYNNELDDTFMENNLEIYEVMYCYVSYLYDKQSYQQISKLFKMCVIQLRYNDIAYKIINANYICQDYDEAIKIINGIANLTYELYMILKNEFPLLFENEYKEKIIECIIEKSEIDEAIKIIKEEKLSQYQLILLAKKDFNLVDDKFEEYLGKYDEQLIKIYQRHIVNNVQKLRGFYKQIPEILMDAFEKMKRLKNGKYYIYEIANELISSYYVSYSDALKKYCVGLGI